MAFDVIPWYKTLGGLQVFRSTAYYQRQRPVPLDKLPKNIAILLVAHFTASLKLDSREYLQRPSDGRVVSCHYLAGEYPDMNNGEPAIIKYAAETAVTTYTQGFGLLGQLCKYDHGSDWNNGVITVNVEMNANDVAIGYEIEAHRNLQPSARLLDTVANHMGEIIRYWDNLGRDVLLIGHGHIDPAKRDPDLSWSKFARLVYSYV